MAKGGRWTREEDALLVEWYPDKGASWDRWADLLPDRGAEAIRNRATVALGLRTRHGAAVAAGMAMRRDERPWTEDEDRAVLRALLDAAAEVGHSPAATSDRLAHWVAVRRAEVARQIALGEWDGPPSS